MKETTLCLLVKDGKILLAMKKRGFGQGLWNGAGGKIQPGESVEQAAVRELQEEVGVAAEPSNLQHMGKLMFYFENQPDWDQSMEIFKIERWQGEPSESDEMRPQWFSFSEIPYAQMWPDDIHWFPKFLAGEKIAGDCYFDETGKIIQRFELK